MGGLTHETQDGIPAVGFSDVLRDANLLRTDYTTKLANAAAAAWSWCHKQVLVGFFNQ